MKQRVGSVARWVFTIAVLIYLFRYRVDVARLGETLRAVRLEWIAAALVCFGVIVAGGTLRWWVLLRAQTIEIPGRRAVAINFVGMFFNSFLPSGTGGDVVKAYYTVRESPNRKTEAALTILVDRVVGLLGLFTITVVMVALHASWLWERPNLRWPAIFAVGLMGGVFGVLAWTMRHSNGGGDSWLARRAKGTRFAPHLERVVESWRSYAGRKRALGIAFAISLVAHAANLAAGACIGASLGIEGVDWARYFLLIPIVNTIASLPITVSGIGVREEMYRRSLAELGVASEPSVALGLLSYAMQLAWSLVGGVVYIFWKPERHLLAHAKDSR